MESRKFVIVLLKYYLIVEIRQKWTEMFTNGHFKCVLKVIVVVELMATYYSIISNGYKNVLR